LTPSKFHRGEGGAEIRTVPYAALEKAEATRPRAGVRENRRGHWLPRMRYPRKIGGVRLSHKNLKIDVSQNPCILRKV